MIHVPFLGPTANVRKYVVSGWDVFHGECFPDTTCCFKMNQTIVKRYHFVCDIKFARRWIDSEPKHNFQMFFFHNLSNVMRAFQMVEPATGEFVIVCNEGHRVNHMS